MVEEFWLGMAIIFFSGVLNGSFALGRKYSTRWKRENTCLVFSVVGILLSPWLMACRFVPRLTGVYQAVPVR